MAGVAQLVEQLTCNPEKNNKSKRRIAGTRMNPTFFILPRERNRQNGIQRYPRTVDLLAFEQ